jgi:hypothetical protein
MLNKEQVSAEKGDCRKLTNKFQKEDAEPG